MRYWHVGILTEDAEGAARAFCAVQGTPLENWRFAEVEFAQSEMRIGDGGRLKSAVGRVGGLVYEFLQPLDDCSYHAQVLRARGPGLHHAAYICEEDQAETVEALLAAGWRTVWEAQHGGEHVCYLEAPGEAAVWEIVNCCPFLPGE